MNSGLARTTFEYKIPAFSQAEIPVNCSNIISEVALSEPLPVLPERSLAGAKCCVSLKESRQTCLRVINPTEKDIVLPANVVIASVSALDAENVLPMCETKDKSQAQSDKNDIDIDTDDILEFDLSNSKLTDEQKDILTVSQSLCKRLE